MALLTTTLSRFGCRCAHCDGKTLFEVLRIFAVTAIGGRFSKKLDKPVIKIREIYPVLRTFRPGNRRIDRVEIKFYDGGVIDVSFGWNAKHSLGLVVITDRVDLRVLAACISKIIERFFVDRKKSHRRPIFRGHIGDSCTVGRVKSSGALAKEFNKFSDNIRFTQHLSYSQNEVCRGRTLWQFAGQMHTHNVRRQKIHGLTEHSSLSLNAADAPADDTEAVDHRSVRIRSDKRIGKINAFPLKHAFRQILKIYLMDNTDSRRDDAKAVKRRRSPL